MRGGMEMLRRAITYWRARRDRPRLALALAGGGVIGGMYEVGALTALEERLASPGGFDVYVGCSAGSVVASLLANGVPASEVYRILDQDLADPLNFRRGAVYSSDAFRHAAGRFGRLVWAVGKNALTGLRGSVPDMLARAERDLPAGLFDLAALERFMREAFAKRGLANDFAALPRTLLVPAVDIEQARRVVFGQGELAGVPISQAIAASSSIPGFFEPYAIDGRDYVDGGVGFCGHADLAALERFMREAFAKRGLANDFAALPRTLLIPAVDIEQARRAVFGQGELRHVPISQAIAASSSIPGFFEPWAIEGRDYVDGGVGFCGHADLAAETGARVVVVVNPLVPNHEPGTVPLRSRGLYSILEQAGRIYSQNLLQLGLAAMRVKYARTEFFLIQPPRADAPMLGPSMGFEASHAALRYGYESTKEWLAGHGEPLLRRLVPSIRPLAV